LVRPAESILELGASVGLMTEVMNSWDLAVTAVEIDPSALERLQKVAVQVIIGDLDDPSTLTPLAGQRFDVILASDVLEHLKDPLRCLRQAAQLVNTTGRVILSIPNFAHADIRLSLLAGNFEYSEMGLLDRTHIKFFTRKTLEKLIFDAGLQPIQWHRTKRPIGESEIPVAPELVEWGKRVLRDDQEADTYQWLVECRPAGSDQTASAGVDADSSHAVVRAITRGRFSRARDRSR
jgi:2-polyprenyl-3-methyl-5-hydroxy-6-metoxy-1,4-benzoquinol methylase